MPEIIQQPICLSGQLSPVHPSFCMDGATHLIHTSIVGALRLLASNAAVQTALEDYAAGNEIVTVCGYVKRSANCSHIEVYAVQPTKDYIASQAPSPIAPPTAMFDLETLEVQRTLNPRAVVVAAVEIECRRRNKEYLTIKASAIYPRASKWRRAGKRIAKTISISFPGYTLGDSQITPFYNKKIHRFQTFVGTDLTSFVTATS